MTEQPTEQQISPLIWRLTNVTHSQIAEMIRRQMTNKDGYQAKVSALNRLILALQHMERSLMML